MSDKVLASVIAVAVLALLLFLPRLLDKRTRCRWLHQGFKFNGIRCTVCCVGFKDRHEAGQLLEFEGRVELDEDRLLDEEALFHDEWKIAGWRVVRGGQITVDANDYSGRRVMGGHDVKKWLAPQPKKRAAPVPLERPARREATG